MIRKLDYKWTLLLFLFVTFFLEQGTRQIFSVTLPQIKLDFRSYGIGDTELGAVGSVFGAVFGLSLVASGLAADFLGRKKVLVFGTLLFSLGVFLTGFAEGIGMMIVCYGIMNAVGQCCIAPPCYSLISQYHDTNTRASAMGIFQSAVYCGVVITSVCAGALATLGSGGWRKAFWIFGALGVVWVIVMSFGMRDTPQPRCGDRVTVKEAFFALLKKPTAILIAIAFGMFTYANLGIRLWLIPFLDREICGSLTSAAFHGVFWHNMGACIGMFATARFMDRIGERRPRIRLEISMVGFLLCIAPIICLSRVSDLMTCCITLFVFGLTLGVYEAAHYPAMFDCINPRFRSVTTGLTGCLAFLFGSSAPIVMGMMSDRFDMRSAIMSLSAFFLLGAIVLLPAVFVYFKQDYIPQNEKER